MKITKILPLSPSTNASRDIQLSAGTYTGELVAWHHSGSDIDLIFVITADTGTDFLVNHTAAEDDVNNIVDSFYGQDVTLRCLKDLIGIPVTVEINDDNGHIRIEPYKPLGSSVCCNN